MALYKWQCRVCEEVTRKIDSKRPRLPRCPACGGKQKFVTNISERVTETIDNGLMPRRLERLKDAERLIKERNDIAEKPDPSLV